ncbi:hypothetical protein [Parageobacillus thermoglucosidasius]|uniref:hypothetical protein n=1 Tax=Parageobacillus thermoglucosidasius TaxID=1426 RepID=UPI001FCBAFB9|nr:hypothetical protein [Parageobacillus thermoglucosidasius]
MAEVDFDGVTIVLDKKLSLLREDHCRVKKSCKAGCKYFPKTNVKPKKLVSEKKLVSRS